MYLECIGNGMNRKQLITPLLAEISGRANFSGAITYAPRQLLPLLILLRAGVRIVDEVHAIAQVINGFPGINWEQFETNLILNGGGF